MFFANLLSCLVGSSAKTSAVRTRLTCLDLEGLEGREVPASLTAGNLNIIGSGAVDTVKVQDVTVNGVAKIRVTHNGSVQDFNAASVTGKVQFWGNGGNDRFDYFGSKNCFADGGAGNDFLSSDRGNDLLVGGSGNDILEGWSGNDELQGGDGDDTLAGGWGDDLLFGQAGDDLLGGEAGNDRIIGGTGADIAFGGSGSDQFWECRDFGIFLVPINTRFGQAQTMGVQDTTSLDRVWS